MTILIFVIIVVAAIVGFIYYMYLNRCPKCKASLFNYNLINKKILGYDSNDKYLRIEQQTYKCLKCKYRWEEITKYNEKGL